MSALLAGAAALSGCGDDGPSGGSGVERLAFQPASIDLGEATQATVELRNTGDLTVGPIELIGGPVQTEAGIELFGAGLQVSPSEISTLAPDAARAVSLSIDLPVGTPPGAFRVSLEARVGAQGLASLALRFSVSVTPGSPVAAVELTPVAGPLRQGDVVQWVAVARDSAGEVIASPPLNWILTPASAGLIRSDGRFVGYEPGPVTVTVFSGAASDEAAIDVVPRGVEGGAFQVVGHGEQTARFTSDLWVHGNVAYTGTWGSRAEGGTSQLGNRLFAWDITDPAAPALADSVSVDARVVNDVKIRADGTLAVLTHEVSNDGRNGITLLDTSDPHHPTVITRLTAADLTPGIHNTWIDGSFLYAVVDGSSPVSGLRVIDVSDPAGPRIVSSFYAGSSFLHDVYVRDGLAFLSHWDAGLVIMDVGSGIAGGSPHSPREVGRVPTFGGQTHNAWYWPEAGYVFVGEEDFATPGIMHVVDARDLRNPTEVASFRVPGDTPHNFWLDEARGILYLAWYRMGLRALDVTGELLGQLERQGREIASVQYGSGAFCFGGAGTCTWAPQLEGGLIYVSDLNTGLWVLQPTF